MRLTWQWPSVLYAPEGVGAGADDGAGSPSLGDDAPSGVADAPPPSEPGPEPAEDDEEDDEDTFDDTRYANDPVVGKLRKQARRLRKSDRAHRELKAMLKAHGVDPARLGDVVLRAKQFDDVDALIKSNPRIRELLVPSSEEAAPQEPADPDFDESAFPFDRQAPGADWMIAQARTLHELQRAVRQIAQQMGVHRRESEEAKLARERESHRSVIASWAAEANKLIAEYDPAYEEQLREVMNARFWEGAMKGEKPTKEALQKILNAAREKAKRWKVPPRARPPVDPRTAQQTRMANANASFPKGGHGGTPAPPQRRQMNVHELGAAIRRSFARY